MDGKVVLITGGGNGIGAAMAMAFNEQGARVFFCDRDGEAGRKAAGKAEGSEFARVDLRKEREIARWVGNAARSAGRIDVLVNNAAIDPRIALEELTAARLDEIYGINLRAMFITAREAAGRMGEGGAIVNFSSITFHEGPALMSAYVASKGGVIALTRSLARELGPRGIRVNTLSPGWVMTERQLRDYVDAATKKRIRRLQCIPELIQPEEIAEVALFLASRASRAITGQEILADRGWAHS